MKKEPRVTIGLIAVNVIVFLLAEVISGSTENTSVLVRWGAASVRLIQDGQYYRLFTSFFLHSGMQHLANNMLLLFALGQHLENLLGPVRYLLLYLASGLGSSAAAYLYYLSKDRDVVAAGASGAVYAVIGALIWIIIRCRGKADGLTLRQMLIMLALSLYFGAVEANVSNAAHISGLLIGFVLSILLYRHDRRGQIRTLF